MTSHAPGSNESKIMDFLHEHVFDPILASPNASASLKSGVRVTIARMNRLDAGGMVRYFWSAVAGTERSIDFADEIKRQGFKGFEDSHILEEFRRHFPKYAFPH
ncbi:MAG: hypothetical protein IPK83_04260 [Planctomycetes bacterium]|nr:hypothetical protein [Planctomycetota bacterium]